MTDLTGFLLARIAEDEEIAQEAAWRAETPWRAAYGRQVETPQDGYLVTPEDTHSDPGDPTHPVGQHIARHDPVRVLAECEAKRQIVAQYEAVTTSAGNDAMSRLEVTLKHLATPYAEHPEFQITWRV